MQDAAGRVVHRAVKRPLLPYQHALCDVLGVSEDDYHDFLAIQQDWTQSEEERLETLRGEPTAIILFAIGVIFQVLSALLAPRPEAPKGGRQTREQRFSPRFAFNSTQELATYGDPVPLVYCNNQINPRGTVRISTSLIWSAVESFGSAQYLQLLLLVGASEVKRIAFNNVAFGQLSLGEIKETNVWAYYTATGGPVRFRDQVLGDTRDPARQGLGSSSIVHQIRSGEGWTPGYSQAYTPTSKTKFGCYNPIPINVELVERRSSGRLSTANNGIFIQAGSWGTTSGNRWVKNDQVVVIFKATRSQKNEVAIEAAQDLRTQLIDTLDQGAVYQLGTALFRAINLGRNRNLDKESAFVIFECIQDGSRPTTSYLRERPKQYDKDKLEQIEEALDALTSPAYATREVVDKVRIEQTAVTLNGANVGIWLKPTLFEPSDIENKEVLQEADIAYSFGELNYNFSGLKTITWTADTGEVRSYTYYTGGSLNYSRRLLDQALNDKPKLRTRDLRKVYDADLEALRTLRDDVSSGGYRTRFLNEAKTETTAVNLLASIKEQRRLRRLAERNDDDIAKQAADDAIDSLQEQRNDFLDRRVGEKQDEYIRFIRNNIGSFLAIDGVRYLGGINTLKGRLNDLKGDFVTDQVGAYAIKNALNDLIAEKEAAVSNAKFIVKNWESLVTITDDSFFTKCIVKYESATYQTITACDYVKLNIRARLFRRISGRSRTYGRKEAPDGYRFSDNGIKGRMAFFSIRYRPTGGAWTTVPRIFAWRRAADNDAFLTLKFESSEGLKKWDFELNPILDPPAEIGESGYTGFVLLNTAGQEDGINVGNERFSFFGELVGISLSGFPDVRERGPIFTNEWDFFSTRSDTQLQSSAEQGPEFELVNVTEQQRCLEAEQKYKDMSLLSIHSFSGAGIQDLRNVTALVREGKRSWVVDEVTAAFTLSNGCTSWAPDIFADTVLDRTNGIGQVANAKGIDWETLALAKRFCRNSGLGVQLFMDGAIADRRSWREFWVEAAPYSLLEFARINGRETLAPALPVTAAGVATRQITIAALFNQGNILEGSYREEFLDFGDNTKDLVATVIYRETSTDEAFPRNESITVARADTNTTDAVWQTFDVSAFVTQRKQAELYGRWLCQQRRWVKSAVEFKTVPTDSPVSPGDYIFVDIGLNRFSSIRSGIVEDGGRLNAPISTQIPNGTYQALTYISGGDVVTRSVTVTNGVAAALADRAGALFSLGVSESNKRVYRITEISMDETGETTIKAVVHPTDPSGLSLVADLRNSLFQEIGATCS